MTKTPAILLLSGEDTYSLRASEEALIAEVVDPGFVAMNLNLLDGATTAPSQAIASAATMPFGPGGRLVIVRDCPYFSSAKFDGAGEIGALIDLFDKGLPGGCHLVFSVPRGLDKRLNQTKAALSKGAVREFPLAKPWEDRAVVDWLMTEAREREIRLGNDVAQALVSSLGTDRWKLGTELSKLGTYAAGTPITLETLAILASPGETDVFEMLKAVADRKPVDAVTRLRRLLVTEASLKVLATMATMMRSWLQVKVLSEQGMNAEAIAQALGAKSSSKTKKDLEQCRQWSSRQLQKALVLLLDADTALKSTSGRASEVLQLERLLVQLTALS